jgi:hypothetical protein
MKQFLLFLCLLPVGFTHAQEQSKINGTAFGLKSGLTIATQNWNGQEREAMFTYNVSAMIEVLNGRRTSFLFGLGYTPKGSAFIIPTFFDPNLNQMVQRRRENIVFNNLGMLLAAKSVYDVGGKIGLYYLAGLRAEYTLNYDLGMFRGSGFENGVRRFNYGFTVGGGAQMQLGKKFQTFLEFTINPDLSRQVFLAPGLYYNIYTGQNQGFAEQSVRNLSIEITLGFKFIKYKEVYEDEDNDLY